jgi:hypothetical protein
VLSDMLQHRRVEWVIELNAGVLSLTPFDGGGDRPDRADFYRYWGSYRGSPHAIMDTATLFGQVEYGTSRGPRPVNRRPRIVNSCRSAALSLTAGAASVSDGGADSIAV